MKEITELESRSKQLYELVVTEYFTVDEVVAESYPTLIIPHSKIQIGIEHPGYEGGFTSRLVLKVTPVRQDVPVRTLIFDGISIVKAGDYIAAKIPKFEEKRLEDEFYFGPYERRKVFYFDRDFNSEEHAIELSILSKDGNILRKDRAINYKDFVKE